MERTRWLMVLVFVLVFGLTAGVANAWVIAYEPFDYTVGQNLQGQDGGTGWAEAWKPGPTDTGTATIQSGSLTHPLLPAGAGGHVLTGTSNEAMQDRSTLETIPDEAGNEAWISFLFTVETEPADGVNWRSLDLFGDTEYTEGGFIAATGQPYSTDTFGLLMPTWAAVESQVLSMNVFQVYWIVLKIEMNGPGEYDPIYLWADPDPTSEPDTGSPDVTVPDCDATLGLIGVMITSFGPGKFDEIRIGTFWEDVAPPNPKLASNPRPGSHKENIDPALALLEWDAPTEVVNPLYDVYFGTDSDVANNPKILEDSAATSVEPNDPAVEYSLAIDTQYYWRVDVNDPNGGVPPEGVMRTGATWNFRTWPLEPVILQQPGDTSVVPGGTTDPPFTVESGGNLAGSHTFTWYKHVGTTQYQDEPNDIEVKAGILEPTGISTLTISNAQHNPDPNLSDEGSYYCKVTNTVPGTTYSDSAGLVLLQLMARYRFENDATDSAGDHDGTNVGPDVWLKGSAEGLKCLNLLGSGTYVYVPDILAEDVGTLDKFTISAWVNPDVGEEGGVIWAGYDDTAGGPPTDGEGIYIERVADGTVFVTIEYNDPDTISVANAIPAVARVKEVQTSTLDALMTGGTFTMAYGGQITVPIAYNASKTQIEDALDLLSTVWPGTITMQDGHEPDTELTCTWTFSPGKVVPTMLSMDIGSATGPTSVTFEETTKGETNWTHVVFVYDSNGVVGTGTLYINGEQATQAKYDTAYAQQIGPFSMGAYLPDGYPAMRYFDGRLDDVRIYAYPISAEQVASLYNEITGESVCVRPESPEPADVNGDCKVDMLDYAELAADWLVSNIVP